MSPTQRSLAYLRKAGYHVGIVERWMAFAHGGIRVDLWNFADLIAFRFGLPVMLIQTTTASNAAARRKKLLGNSIARDWVLAGNELVLHKWALRGEKGQRKTWGCDAEWLEKDAFAPEEAVGAA